MSVNLQAKRSLLIETRTGREIKVQEPQCQRNVVERFEAPDYCNHRNSYKAIGAWFFRHLFYFVLLQLRVQSSNPSRICVLLDFVLPEVLLIIHTEHDPAQKPILQYLVRAFRVEYRYF